MVGDDAAVKKQVNGGNWQKMFKQTRLLLGLFV